MLFLFFCIFKQMQCLFNLLHFLVYFVSIEIPHYFFPHGCSLYRHLIPRVLFKFQDIFRLSVVVGYALFRDVLFDFHEILNPLILLLLLVVLLLGSFLVLLIQVGRYLHILIIMTEEDLPDADALLDSLLPVTVKTE